MARLGVQADGPSGKRKSDLKKLKVRRERHIAKRNPDTPPAYGKYRGYET